MSKMRCKCGNILSDVLMPCPTEGWLTGEHDREIVDQDFTEQVRQFLEAVREGRRGEWITRCFNEHYPQDLPDAQVIADLLNLCSMFHSLSVAECSSCGRLHVQKEPDRNDYRIFVPEEAGYHQVLASTEVPRTRTIESLD